MLTETKLWIATAGTGLTTIGAYEWAPRIEFFQQNEALLHSGQIGLVIATVALALATAAVRHHRIITTEGKPTNPQSVEIIPFDPKLSKMSSYLMRRRARKRKRS